MIAIAATILLTKILSAPKVALKAAFARVCSLRAELIRFDKQLICAINR